MLIFRYLAKEVFITLAALTVILLLIFMSNQFVIYLNRAVSGQIPAMIIIKLMLLELPNLLGLLLPLGFYVALLVAYGRLYADSEMIVMQACGYGPPQLLRHSFIMASLVSLMVAVLMIWGSPLIAMERAKLLRASGIQLLVKMIMPGRFRAVSNDKQVFYVETVSRNHLNAQHLFLAQQTPKATGLQWNVLFAERAFMEVDLKTSEDYLIFQNGWEYEGLPGEANFQVVHFDQYRARLPHPTITNLQDDIRIIKTSDLLPWSNPDKRKAAELQWRLSVPLMVLTLTLVAVPLSRVNPRTGKYAKLLPAILLYILYANFMFITRNWVAVGKIPLWLGMWWVHLVVAAIGLLLIVYNRKKLA